MALSESQRQQWNTAVAKGDPAEVDQLRDELLCLIFVPHVAELMQMQARPSSG